MEKKTWQECQDFIRKRYYGSEYTPLDEEDLLEAAELYAEQEKKAYALSCIEATTKKIEAELKFRDSESMYHPDWYECLEAIKNPANTVLL